MLNAITSLCARHVGARPALLLVLALMATLATAPAGAEYRLQLGDTVRVILPELPGSESVAVVDIDGNVRVPRVGTLRAAGKTLTELKVDVGRALTGQIVSIYRDDGQRVEVALDGSAAVVDVVAYLPVYLMGNVAAPGEVEYRPGMTVRAAVARAGGFAPIPQVLDDAVMQIPTLQSSYQTLTVEHASTAVRRWGVDALLNADLHAPPPQPADVFIDADLLERLIADERQRVEVILDGHEETRRALRQRLDFLDEGISRLERTLANHEAALAIEEEDLERIRGLSERGLAAASRLSDARQALLLVSSSVLDAQDSIAQLALQRRRAQQELDLLRQEFQRPFLAERAELQQALINTEVRLTAATETLALNGEAARTVGATAEPIVQVTVRRTLEGVTEVVAADLDSPLRPGDIAQILVRYPYLLPTRPGGVDTSPSAAARPPAVLSR